MNLIDKISKEKTLQNRTWLGNFVYKSLIVCRRKKVLPNLLKIYLINQCINKKLYRWHKMMREM